MFNSKCVFSSKVVAFVDQNLQPLSYHVLAGKTSDSESYYSFHGKTSCAKSYASFHGRTCYSEVIGGDLSVSCELVFGTKLQSAGCLLIKSELKPFGVFLFQRPERRQSENIWPQETKASGRIREAICLTLTSYLCGISFLNEDCREPWGV